VQWCGQGHWDRAIYLRVKFIDIPFRKLNLAYPLYLFFIR